MASSQPKSKAVARRELSANNYIAAVAAISLIVVLVCGLIGKSMVSSLVINTKLIAGKAQAKHDLDTKLANIPTLLDNYNNLGNTKKLISDGMPVTSDFPQIISIVQSIGTAAGVTIKSIAPPTSDTAASTPSSSGSPASASPGAAAASSGGASPTPYVFTASISGSYNQIVQLFKNLELSDRPMHVTATQITSSSGILSVQATIQTYYQAPADISDKAEAVK